MTLGDVVPAAAACGDEAEPLRAPGPCVGHIAGDRLSDERRHGLALAARHGPELAFELLVDENRRAFHMIYDIIHQGRFFAWRELFPAAGHYLFEDDVLTNEQLMFEVRSGSREAFEALFERHREAVWHFFRRRVDDPARAEELVQDVFVAVLRGARRYEPRADFRSYLFGIAFNVLKAERRRATAAPGPLDVDVARSVSDPDAVLWVRHALTSLAPDHREIVMLREYDGLSYQEIADVLHLPVNTVRTRLYRARMDLRDALLRQSPLQLKVGNEGH